jgi:phytoene dehydrogenase-like protein
MSSRHRGQISGQFAPRLVEMLESPAFRALSLSAHRIISRVEIELAHHGGKDNGRLPVTYDDFESYGIDRHAIRPAIREAVALGFLEITRPGRAGNAEFRTPNLFRLTYRAAKGVPGDGSHEWRRIDSKDAAVSIQKAARNMKAQKTKDQWGKSPNLGGENPHPKPEFDGGNNPTTALSGNSPTTIDISGMNGASARLA